MNKKIFLLSVAFMIMVSGGIIYAGESSGLNKIGVDNLFKEKMRQDRLEEREEIRNEIKSARQEFQQKLEIKREENKEILIKNKENLRVKIQTIKDENKKEAVLNINENINKINERTTDRLNNLITIIEEILGRIENKMETAEGQGLDFSSLESSINEAKIKITEAKDLIEIQAGKIYKLEITNELNLREEVKIVRNALQDDLKNLQNKVKEAHSFTRTSAQKLVEILTTSDNEEEIEYIENQSEN